MPIVYAIGHGGSPVKALGQAPHKGIQTPGVG